MRNKMHNIYVPFRYKKINNKYLITGDYFNWVFINKAELNKLKKKNIDRNSILYKKLLENKFILDSGKQTENLIENKRYALSNIFSGPSLHIIVLTRRCNQSCIYCHAGAIGEDKKTADMNNETAKKTVDLIMNSPNKYITIEFQGGEPLLNFKTLQYIYEYATELNKKIKKNLKFSVVTNLELMDNQKFKWFLSKKIGICTSLDGPKKLHDKNRPSVNYNSSYDNVIKWIEKAKNKNIILGALITVSKESLEYPIEIVDEYVKQGYNNLHLRNLHYLGKAANVWKNIGYNADEFIMFWRKAMDHILELNKKGIHIQERLCNIILQKILNKHEPGYLDLMSPCGAIIGQIAYNYDGKIYSCDEARTLDEDIFQIGDKNCKSVTEIISDQKSIEIISSTINDTYFCDYCAYKTFCGICPVCNYKETGSPISDVLTTNRCKMLMGIFDYIFEKIENPEIRKIFEDWVNPKNTDRIFE
jgi:uncharacterized protein